MLFCSNYAKNYASTIRQGLHEHVVSAKSILQHVERTPTTVEFEAKFKWPIKGPRNQGNKQCGKSKASYSQSELAVSKKHMAIGYDAIRFDLKTD